MRTLYSGLYSRGADTGSVGPGAPIMDKRWTWLAMIDKLSNGDITKHNEIYDKNWIECLNLLSYYNERDKYMEKINKIQSLKSNSRYGK